MIQTTLYIKKYDWILKVFYAVTCYHTDEILISLKNIDCPDDIIERVNSNLQDFKMDTGFTYSNKKIRSTVMVIGLWSSKSQFLNSFSHELRHLLDDITETFNLPSSGEEVAYLTGEINEHLFNDVHLFTCDCKKCNHTINKRLS